MSVKHKWASNYVVLQIVSEHVAHLGQNNVLHNTTNKTCWAKLQNWVFVLCIIWSFLINTHCFFSPIFFVVVFFCTETLNEYLNWFEFQLYLLYCLLYYIFCWQRIFVHIMSFVKNSTQTFNKNMQHNQKRCLPWTSHIY